MSCFFQGKLCAANGLLFFYLVAHTIVCCQVEKTEGKKTTFFSSLSALLEKAFPMTFQNKVPENPIGFSTTVYFSLPFWLLKKR